MAKAMSYDDQFGNHYSESYWRLVQINVGVAGGVAQVTFYGYKDAAARQSGKQSIGSKSYTVSGQQFADLYAAHVAPGGPNMMVLAYQVASADEFFRGAENV